MHTIITAVLIIGVIWVVAKTTTPAKIISTARIRYLEEIGSQRIPFEEAWPDLNKEERHYVCNFNSATNGPTRVGGRPECQPHIISS